MRHVSRTDPRLHKRLDWRRRGGSWTGGWWPRNRATDTQHSDYAVGDVITYTAGASRADGLQTATGGASE